MAQRCLSEADRQYDLLRHCCVVARHNCAQNGGIDPFTLRHIDAQLGARTAVFPHHGNKPGGAIGREREIFAVSAQALYLAEHHHRLRIGVDHFADVTRIIVPGMLKSDDLTPQEPFQHCCSPLFPRSAALRHLHNAKDEAAARRVTRKRKYFLWKINHEGVQETRPYRFTTQGYMDMPSPGALSAWRWG